jgi:hypothetical protein
MQTIDEKALVEALVRKLHPGCIHDAEAPAGRSGVAVPGGLDETRVEIDAGVVAVHVSRKLAHATAHVEHPLPRSNIEVAPKELAGLRLATDEQEPDTVEERRHIQDCA